MLLQMFLGSMDHLQSNKFESRISDKSHYGKSPSLFKPSDDFTNQSPHNTIGFNSNESLFSGHFKQFHVFFRAIEKISDLKGFSESDESKEECSEGQERFLHALS
jgi:hypothetical protein